MLFGAVAFVCFIIAKLWLLAAGKGFRLCGGDKGLCPLDPCHPLIKRNSVLTAVRSFLRKPSRIDVNFILLRSVGKFAIVFSVFV